MTKKQIINQVNLAAGMGRNDLNFMLRYQRLGHVHLVDMQAASATAYNQCAGNLARALGLASYIWDKPMELTKPRPAVRRSMADAIAWIRSLPALNMRVTREELEIALRAAGFRFTAKTSLGGELEAIAQTNRTQPKTP